jgi:hypothetical protein
LDLLGRALPGARTQQKPSGAGTPNRTQTARTHASWPPYPFLQSQQNQQYISFIFFTNLRSPPKPRNPACYPLGRKDIPMATQPQIDANRANAQKSTGPRTPEGRAAVRQNALKHGLTSMSPVAPGEDPAEFLQFLAYWTQSYLPIGPAEEEVLRTAVVASWRLRRIPAIEAGYYELEQSSDPSASAAARLAFAHYQCAKQLEALSCQEARLQRTFDKALREIERLQARPDRGPKAELENQTQFPIQPEENDSAAAAQSPSESNPAPPRSAAEADDSENQTQFPAQSQKTPPDAAPAPVVQPVKIAGVENQTQSPAATPTPEEVQAASDLITRVFAQLPKTA